MALATPTIIRRLLTNRSTVSLLRVNFAALLALVMMASPLKAATGLRTDFGDVLIENLGIGADYNLRDLAGIPFKITNTGADTIDLVIEVTVPTEKLIPEHRRKAGFNPIPSADWVKLTRNKFIVPAGESAYSDILISIPNDPSLYGKKFQASIFSRMTGQAFVNVGLWSHLMITIVESPEKQAQLKDNRKRGLINLDYSLLPDKLTALNAPYGKTMNFAKDIKRDMRLVNSGEEAVDLKAVVIPVSESPLTLQDGFEAGNPAWIGVKQQIFHLEPTDIADLGIQLKLPNDKTLAGKRLMFIVKVEPANKDIIGTTFYGKIYVEVQGVKK